MAKIVGKGAITFEVTFTVSESEARALDALTGYGDDAFIEKFKESLGAYYIRNYENGLRDFLRTIREMMPGQLARLDAARMALGEQ